MSDNNPKELSQSFKDFLKELYLEIESDEYTSIADQFNRCCRFSGPIIRDRLKYVTTEYTDNSPPGDGSTNYQVIFHDIVEDKFLAFTPNMSSWFEWEQVEEVYQEDNWEYVYPIKSEVTVWSVEEPSEVVANVPKEELSKLDPMTSEILSTIKEMVSKGHISYEDLLAFYYNRHDDEGEVRDICLGQLQEKFGEIQEVDGWRSDSGDHDTYYKVIKFAKCETNFMGEGYYSSNDGVDFSYCNSIIPVVQTEIRKTVWQEVKY